MWNNVLEMLAQIVPMGCTSLIKKFGVWGPKKLFGREYDGVLRTTFVLENGIVRRIIDEVKSKSHAAQILQ